MKTIISQKIKFTISLCLLSVSLSANAQNSNWLNYTNGDLIIDMADAGADFWVATSGGLVKIDKATNAATFYNKGNSDMPRNSIIAMAVDSSEQLWIISEAGLSLFDGTNWTHFTTINSGLPTSNIFDIAIDQNQNKWIGSSLGLIFFDGSNWVLYDTANSSISNQYVTDISISPTGEKWMYTYNGIERFDGSSWTLYDLNTIGVSLFEVFSFAFLNGDVYVASNGPFGQGYGLLKFDGVIWSAYTPANSGLPYSNADFVAIDTIGNLWIANRGVFTFGESLVKFDGINWTNFPIDSIGVNNYNINHILIDANNEIYTGSNGEGLSEFSNGSFLKINTSNSGLTLMGGAQIFIDDQNEEWITNYLGFTHFNGQSWEVFDSSNSAFLNDAAYAVIHDHSGNSWIGGNDGLTKFDGLNWMKFDSANSDLGDNRVNALAVDSANNIWVGTNTAPFKFDGTTWTNYFSDAGSHVTDIFVTDDADVWLGSPGYGLSRFDLVSSWQHYLAPAGAFQAGAMDKNGIVWFGGNNLHSWNGSVWTDYTTADGLPWSQITALAIDTANNVWIGTQFGLSKFDGISFTNYFIDNSGLTGNYITDIDVDANNNKWIGTDAGISVFNEAGVVLGIEETMIKTHNADVVIFPNPVSNFFNLQLKNINNFSKVDLRIYDVSGREVMSAEIHNSQTEIQRGGIASGMYFYMLYKNDIPVATGKIIVR